jgi:hypothetical protein
VSRRQLLRSSRLGAAAVLAALSLLACGGEDPETVDPVGAIPWTAPEISEYQLAERGDIVGTGFFRIEADGENVRLVQEFKGDNGSSDTRTVIAEAESLGPISMERTVLNEDGSPRTQIRASYTEDAAAFESTTGERTVTQTRNRAPNSFDSEQHLFIGRTITLSDGYQAHYRAMDAATTQSRVIDLRVTEQEMVEVPAGEFLAWKVEFRHASATTTAWYSVEPPYYLVKAKVSDFEYLLVTEPEPP